MSLRELTDEVIKDFIKSLKEDDEFDKKICDKLENILLEQKGYTPQKIREAFYGEDII